MAISAFGRAWFGAHARTKDNATREAEAGSLGWKKRDGFIVNWHSPERDTLRCVRDGEARVAGGDPASLGFGGRQERDAPSWSELKELSFPAIQSLRFDAEKNRGGNSILQQQQ